MSQDTTSAIWDLQWHCKVPQLQTTSEEYIRFFGTPTTFNNDIDRELAKQWIDTMLNIAKMVDLFRDGVPIRIVKYDDTKKIYDHIESHLQAWVYNLEHNLNIGDAPIDDLIAMNEFANNIHPIARSLYSGEIPGSSFMRAIEKLGFNVISDKMHGTITNTDEDTNLSKRKDLGDVFKNIRKGKGPWT